MKTNDYIDAVREKYSLTSDYQAAKKLKISTSRIGNYRSNRSCFNEELAKKIANILDIPLSQILLDIQVERSTNKDVKKAWVDISKKMAGIAALLVLVVNLQLENNDLHDVYTINDLAANEFAQTLYYVK